MRGPYDALDRLAQHYRRHLAQRQRGYETEMGWSPGELEFPRLITPTTPPGEIGSEHWPALLLSVIATPASVLLDQAPMGTAEDPRPTQSWEVTYTVRTEVLVSAARADVVDRWRYGQMTAVRETLLAHRALDDAAAELAPATVRPPFTEQVDDVGGDNQVAYTRGIVEVGLAVVETLYGTPGIPVSRIDVGAHPVGLREQMPADQPPAWHPADGPP